MKSSYFVAVWKVFFKVLVKIAADVEHQLSFKSVLHERNQNI